MTRKQVVHVGRRGPAFEKDAGFEVRHDGRRVLIFEDGLHIGTIWEALSPKEARDAKQQPLYMWYTAHAGGRAHSLEDATDAIMTEVER